MMNEKAEEIGMYNTNFTNASGINDPDNVSTVRDIAIMSKYLINTFPNYYDLFKEKHLHGIEPGVNQSNKGIEILYCIKTLVLMG